MNNRNNAIYIHPFFCAVVKRIFCVCSSFLSIGQYVFSGNFLFNEHTEQWKLKRMKKKKNQRKWKNQGQKSHKMSLIFSCVCYYEHIENDEEKEKKICIFDFSVHLIFDCIRQLLKKSAHSTHNDEQKKAREKQQKHNRNKCKRIKRGRLKW